MSGIIEFSFFETTFVVILSKHVSKFVANSDLEFDLHYSNVIYECSFCFSENHK